MLEADARRVTRDGTRLSFGGEKGVVGCRRSGSMRPLAQQVRWMALRSRRTRSKSEAPFWSL